jgi:hypothetical protein
MNRHSTPSSVWFVPSDTVLDLVRTALKEDRVLVSKKSKELGKGCPVFPDALALLFSRRSNLRDFVTSTALQAVSTVVLSSQRDHRVQVVIGSEGNPSKEIRDALAGLLPESLIQDRAFLSMFFLDIVRSVQAFAHGIDVGRGTLFVVDDAVKLELMPLEPKSSVHKITARIDTAATS